MLHKTRGIVFRTIRYSDSSIITHIYTEQFGLQSYVVNGVNSKRAKIKANIFQPLTIVDLNVSNRGNSSLHRISDLTQGYAFSSIHSDMRKGAVVLFLNEMLYKSIKEEEPNPVLFQFINHALQILDLTTESCANFHLVFLARLAGLLGFSPQGEYTPETSYFNLNEGFFQSHEPSHAKFLSPALALLFSKVLDSNFETAHGLEINSAERRLLLRSLIDYYELHISSVKEIKSHLVLEEVLG